MSSTNTASDELRESLTEYCNHKRNIYDIESVKSLLTKVSEDQRYELLSAVTDYYRNTVLKLAAGRRHTELCVTLLSSLPSADRLRLILVDKITALHWAASLGYTETASGILSCLTAEQQLQLLFTQDSGGDTALHGAARWEHTETVKNLLDKFTPEQQLKLLSVKNDKGLTASQEATGISALKNTEKILEQYRIEAQYRVKYREFAQFTQSLNHIKYFN